MKIKIIFFYLIILNFIMQNACDIQVIPTNKIPSTPILSSPSNNAVDINLNVVLYWNNAKSQTESVIKYNVYFGTVNPPTIKVKELQIDTSFTPSLKSNTLYYWKIQAVDEKGGVSESEVWSFKTIVPLKSILVLNSPENNATNVALNSYLSWSISSGSNNKTIKYDVFLDIINPPVNKVSEMQTETSFLPSLLSNTTYFWKINAYDGNGDVLVSEVRTFKTLLSLATIPVLISPPYRSINRSLKTTLIWNASTCSSGKVVKYDVFLDTLNPPVNKVSNLQTAISYITFLYSYTNYYWKIKADDGYGCTSESEVSTFKTALVLPSVPILLTPANNTNEVSINPVFIWNASMGFSDKVVKYDVFLDTINPPVKMVSYRQTDTIYKTFNLNPFKTYYWKILANDGKNGFVESEVSSFKTLFCELVYVEGGTFNMGCTPKYIGNCVYDEIPSFSVTLSSFSIGKFELTQAQWVSIMGSIPNDINICDDCPVNFASWDFIQIFIEKLNTKTGRNYRLPTEAEWEYAARGGKKSKEYYYSGDNVLDSVGWYMNNSNGKIHSVGTKKPNELGIYDMSGNAFEWCGDWYDYYTKDAKTNPTGARTGTLRVVRGGHWDGYSFSSRVTFRGIGKPDVWSYSVGIRLVLP